MFLMHQLILRCVVSFMGDPQKLSEVVRNQNVVGQATWHRTVCFNHVSDYGSDSIRLRPLLLPCMFHSALGDLSTQQSPQHQ